MGEINWDALLTIVIIFVFMFIFMGFLFLSTSERFDRERIAEERQNTLKTLRYLTTRDKKVFSPMDVALAYSKKSYRTIPDSSVLSALKYLCKIDLVERISKHEFRLTEHKSFDKMPENYEKVTPLRR